MTSRAFLDANVLISAILSPEGVSRRILTGDKEHFLANRKLKDCVGFRILSPREFLESIAENRGRGR